MSWLIFAGDMVVMLFMIGLVIWVSAGASKATLDYSAQIPLVDDKAPARVDTPVCGRPRG